MRIAYFSPFNPQRSGISDYSEELLPHLAQHVDIDLFVDGYTPNNPEITRNFEVHHHQAFDRMWRRRRYDVALYHVGNHPCHEYIYHTLLSYPGITVLHDYILHHFILEITVAKGDDAGYVREMGYAYGGEGTAAAREAIRARGNYPTQRYPLNERAIDSSLGVLVHNDFSKMLVRASHPSTPVAKVAHGMDIDGDPPIDCRRSLGLGEDVFVVGTFGLATPEKRLDVVLRAFKHFHNSLPNSLLLVVGDVPPWNDVRRLVRDLELDDSVKITGFVDKQTLREYIQASDVCVNLRYPTCGETSGMVLRSMAAARPVIVSNVGSFSELPDGPCVKIFLDEAEIDSLAASFKRLAENRALRDQMGLEAREYIRHEHDRASVAKDYVNFIRDTLDAL